MAPDPGRPRMARRPGPPYTLPVQISIMGGTGFIGRALVRELNAAGHEPHLIVRPGPSRRPLRHLRPAPRRTAVRSGDIEGLARALAGADAVVNLVGIIAECGSQTFEHAHVTITRALVTAAGYAGVRRLVQMSALGARAGAPSRYHQTKWRAEEAVRSSDLDWTIFRPSMVFGDEDQFTRLFARLSAWSPVLPVMGTGTHLLQPVSVANVARAFAEALARPESVKCEFDLCGAQRLTFCEVLRAIASAGGRRRLLVRVPMPLARALAGTLEAVFPTLLRRPPPLNRDQLVMLQEDNIGDGSPADRLFGLVHHPFVDELRRQMARGLEAGV